MALSIQFGRTTKARNSTLVPSLGSTVPCLLKDGTSIVRPTFRIHLNHNGAPSFSVLTGYNYCYVTDFRRYYYITDIVAETAAIALISCEVDVLATFREDILNTSAFVMYAESRYNPLVPDSRLPMLGTSTQLFNSTAVSIFSEEGSFALTGVTPDSTGETGAATTLGLDKSGLQQVSQKLYSTDFFDSIKNDFYRPEEALLACMWTPLKLSEILGGGSSDIEIGKYNLVSGPVVKRTVTVSTYAIFNVPLVNTEGSGNLGDYRNYEPYSKYLLTLPGVGTVDIPIKLLAGDVETFAGTLALNIDIAASPVSGDVTYNIRLCGLPKGTGITIKGNFGVEVPISRTVGRFGSILQSLGGTAASVVAGVGTGLMTESQAVTSLAGAAASNAIQSVNVNTNVVGTLGGWSVKPELNYTIEAKTVMWNISDNPNNIRKTIGRPLFANVSRLGSLSGLVKCTGAYVKTWATNEEHSLISQYVNSSVNYLYGGLIIE